MVCESIREESVYHFLLSKNKDFRVGTFQGDLNLRNALKSYGSFKEIYKKFSKETQIDKTLFKEIPFDYGILKVGDKNFPSFFSEYPRSSPVLYYRGDLSLLKKKSIGVVGTRRLEDGEDVFEGKRVLERVLKREYVVVSGLALGCDTLAHSETIKREGKTIGVLGNPLDVYYPRKNKKLQEEIGENHLLISQYPFGIRTFPSHYAHRNLSLVGLSSEGIVVIRADDKSGTKYAIKYCSGQGKSIYVLNNNLNKGYKWIDKFRESIKIPNRELK